MRCEFLRLSKQTSVVRGRESNELKSNRKNDLEPFPTRSHAVCLRLHLERVGKRLNVHNKSIVI